MMVAKKTTLFKRAEGFEMLLMLIPVFDYL
jgi:hypothetical protein